MRIHKVIVTHKFTGSTISWTGYAEDIKDAQTLFLKAISNELLDEIVQGGDENFKVEIYRAKEPG